MVQVRDRVHSNEVSTPSPDTFWPPATKTRIQVMIYYGTALATPIDPHLYNFHGRSSPPSYSSSNVLIKKNVRPRQVSAHEVVGPAASRVDECEESNQTFYLSSHGKKQSTCESHVKRSLWNARLLPHGPNTRRLSTTNKW